MNLLKINDRDLTILIQSNICCLFCLSLGSLMYCFRKKHLTLRDKEIPLHILSFLNCSSIVFWESRSQTCIRLLE